MGVFDAGDKVRIYQYKPSKIELLLPGKEPEVIPNERLRKITIINDYENNYFPIFSVEIVLEASRYYKIIKQKTNVKFHLVINKFYHYNGEQDNSLNYKWIDDTFDLILDDNDEDNKMAQKQEEASNNYTSVTNSDINDLNQVDNKVEFYMFKSSIIKGLKQTVNKILTNATVTDGICYICGEAGIKNLLMTPPVNSKRYENLVIPPLSRCKAIQFLDTYYGLYKTGSMIYFGLNRSYILKYIGGCTAYEKKEVKNTSFVIPSQTSIHTTENGVLYKKNKTNTNYLVCDNNSTSNRNDSISNDVINGNDVTYVDSLTGDMDENESDAEGLQGNTTTVKVNNTENSWLGQTYTAQSSKKNNVIDIRINNADLDMIEPNKKLNVVYEDTQITNKYNGDYILAYASHELSKDGDYLGVSSIVRLKRG